MASKFNPTTKTQEALKAAVKSAKTAGHPAITTAHAVEAILSQKEGLAGATLTKVGADPQIILKEATKIIRGIAPTAKKGQDHNPNFDNQTVEALNRSSQLADELDDEFVSTEVLLASIAKVESEIQRIMVANGATYDAIKEAFLQIRNGDKVENRNPENQFRALSKYATDLTARAREGKIDPIIGRDQEMRRIIQILSRRSKNNPIVVGEPGSGKALTDDTLVPVYDPSGEVTALRNGDLQEGIYVYNRQGIPKMITGVFPQGEKQVFRVHLSDGRIIECNDEHLWTYRVEGSLNWVTGTLREMIEITSGMLGEEIFIPMNQAVHLPEVDDETSFYDKGVLATNARRSITIADVSGSVPQRWKFIQGMFDTNGDITDDKSYQITYRSDNYNAVSTARTVLFSLGVSTTIKRHSHGFVLTVNVNNARKDKFFSEDSIKSAVAQDASERASIKEKYTGSVLITHIENTHNSQPMTCITVDDSEHLYQAGDYVVTHNTAVVEGLARRIVQGDVPESLKDKRLMSLDMTAMIAGAKYRGEFEERLKGVLDDIKKSDGQIITFIDEIHTIVGAGGEGAGDAANMIKPMLARGELHLIGATTLDEYRLHIEKDPALERRFQRVLVEEPSVNEAIGIMRGIKEKYEIHHGVRIQDPALVAAVELSARYITDRFLPDKAIDLMDESASRLKMDIDSSPEELDRLERSVRQLEIERAALKRETDEASTERLSELELELSDEQEKLSEMKTRWSNEKAVIDEFRKKKSYIDEMKDRADKAEREGKFDVVAEIRYKKLPQLEQELREAEKNMQESSGGSAPMVSEEVTPDIVAEVVSTWTGIPAGKMLHGESKRLQDMESILQERVVGQDHATEAIAKAVRRSRSGVSDPDRPIGSFMFLGKSGTGKTELAKSVADFMFDDEKAMVRIDMSEFGEKHSVSRLVGAPPGYVGYEQGGQLTEAVRRKPYTVVLFDEVEKAHPDVFDILLQVLDEGRLTDGQSKLIDFRNTVLILTSNLGATGTKDDMISAAKKHFKPEFINRLDSLITFNVLEREQLSGIVNIQLKSLIDRMANQRIGLEVNDDARMWIADRGYDPAYGARPLRRAIQDHLGDPLSDLILDGGVAEEGTVYVGVEPDKSKLILSDTPVPLLEEPVVDGEDHHTELPVSVAQGVDPVPFEQSEYYDPDMEAALGNNQDQDQNQDDLQKDSEDIDNDLDSIDDDDLDAMLAETNNEFISAGVGETSSDESEASTGDSKGYSEGDTGYQSGSYSNQDDTYGSHDQSQSGSSSFDNGSVDDATSQQTQVQSREQSQDQAQSQQQSQSSDDDDDPDLGFDINDLFDDDLDALFSEDDNR